MIKDLIKLGISKLDINHDGKINKEDLKALLEKVFDKDNDGEISLSEAVAGIALVAGELNELNQGLKKFKK